MTPRIHTKISRTQDRVETVFVIHLVAIIESAHIATYNNGGCGGESAISSGAIALFFLCPICGRSFFIAGN